MAERGRTFFDAFMGPSPLQWKKLNFLHILCLKWLKLFHYFDENQRIFYFFYKWVWIFCLSGRFFWLAWPNYIERPWQHCRRHVSTNKAAVPAGWLSASERTYIHTAHGGQFKCSQCGRTAEGVPSDLDRGRVDDPSVQWCRAATDPGLPGPNEFDRPPWSESDVYAGAHCSPPG